MELSEQDQLRYGIAAGPNNGVLFIPDPECFCRFKGDTQHQEARLSRPQVGRMLPNSGKVLQAPSIQLNCKRRLPLAVFASIKLLAERIEGGDECTAFTAMGCVQGSKLNAAGPHSEHEGIFGMDGVIRFQIGLDGGCVDG